MTFWLIAGGLGMLVALSLALAFRRAGRDGLDAAESNLLVYKDQLDEIDRDVARGILSEADAEAVRLEVQRRLLQADKKAQKAARSGPGPSTWPALLTLVAVGGGALGLYGLVGAPGYPDLPLAQRIEAAEAARAGRPGQMQAEAEALPSRPDLSQGVEADFLALMDRLRGALEDRPTDLEGHRLLARNEARLGHYPEARAAQARVVTLLGEAAGADDWADLADVMILAAGGYVSPEAEAALAEALARDPENGTARYYQGLLEIQVGRHDLAFAQWVGLLADSRADDPWLPLVRSQIEELALLAGVRFDLATAPGPSAEDLAAAAGFDPEAMVERLAQRLAEEGGPPQDWARLIASLGVLGQTVRAEAIADEALAVFSGDAEAVAMIEEALFGRRGEPE
ncbi:MAG: c-type cytochrome biogenesis protein CcmI [Pseudomonadota bacterium]